MSLLNEVTELSGGNPGALTFLSELLFGDIKYVIPALCIIPKIKRCEIKGDALYVLYSDLCNKDVDLIAKLCKDVPDDILKDACSRQDYSGRELVKNYISS